MNIYHMNRQKRIDSITVGFALFAMFFGAGNLIIPPILGLTAGTAWFPSVLGFAITSVCATFLGIMAVVVSGDNFNDVGNRINPIFSIIITAICMLSIGPLVAIPRTAATTFEIGVQPLFNHTSPILSSILFFSITLILSLSSTRVVDIIGKILTPLLLIILIALIILGVIHPLNTDLVQLKSNSDAFVSGFREGYQTMDLLASFVMAGIIISAIKAKGHQQEKDKKQVTITAALIAMSCLILIYGGLVFLGATSGYTANDSIQRTELLLHISKGVLGKNGTLLLSVCVALACLTTAIALTSAVSDYFNKLSNNLLSYRLLVIVICVFSGFLAVYGVDNIIDYAYPFLAVIYPIAVSMAFFIVFFGKFIKDKRPYIAVVSITFIIALIGLFEYLDIARDYMQLILKSIPLNRYEIPWFLPSLLGFIIVWLLVRKNNSNLN